MTIVSDFTDDHASHVTGIETRNLQVFVFSNQCCRDGETRSRNRTIRYFQSCMTVQYDTSVPLYHTSARPNSLSCLFQRALQNNV